MKSTLIKYKKSYFLIVMMLTMSWSNAQHCEYNEDKIPNFEACVKGLKNAFFSMESNEDTKHNKTGLTREEMYEELEQCYTKLIAYFEEEDYDKELLYKKELTELKKNKNGLVAKKKKKQTSKPTKKKSDKTVKKDTTNTKKN